MSRDAHHRSFQVSFLFTTITTQRKVFSQPYSVWSVFFGIGPISLWPGSEPRNIDLEASSLENSEGL